MSRRRSKWDVPATEVAAESNNGELKSATEDARERAAKLTAMLAAKGKLANNVGAPLPVASRTVFSQPSQKADKEQELLYAEVEINDSPARVILCKGITKDEINRYSGAAISTKGRYMDAEEMRHKDKDGERPLYLCIQATTQDKIEFALKRIHEIMNGTGIQGKLPMDQTSMHTRWSPYQPTITTVNNSFSSSTAPITQLPNQTLPTGMHYIQDKVFVGLEQASPEFNAKDKLLGPGGSYFQHICTETGAKVFLRGKGSGFLELTSGREAFEALHIYLSHTKQDGLSAARKLVENLIQTVNHEHQSFEQRKRGLLSGYPPLPGYPQPGYLNHPYGYPPGMCQPPGGFLPPQVPAAPHYGNPHLRPVGPPQPPPPPPPHGQMMGPLPPGYGGPPRQQAPPFVEPPVPEVPQNGGPTPYHPNVPYPSRPDVPPVAYNGPQYPAPPRHPPQQIPLPLQHIPHPLQHIPHPLQHIPQPPQHMPHLPQHTPHLQLLNEKPPNDANKRDHVQPPVIPQPEPPKRRFKEVRYVAESQQSSQPRTSTKETSREASYLGTKKDQASSQSSLPQQSPKQDYTYTMPPPPPPGALSVLPPKQQPKTSDQDFKKPLGLTKPFIPPLPPKIILGKQQSIQKPSLSGTKKHGLSSSTDNPEPKKAKKDEPEELPSYSGIGSLVAYEGDSSEEEDDEQQHPVIISKQNEIRPSSRTKKQQNLPFWAVGK